MSSNNPDKKNIWDKESKSTDNPVLDFDYVLSELRERLLDGRIKVYMPPEAFEGEANQLVSNGGGVSLVLPKSGDDLNIKSLVGDGSHIVVENGASGEARVRLTGIPSIEALNFTELADVTLNSVVDWSIAAYSTVDGEFVTRDIGNHPSVMANTAKRSYPLSDENKLAGIEVGAEVNPTASEIKGLYEANSDTNAFTNSDQADLADATLQKHDHGNKALLDTYTQTEVDLADAVTLKHSHSNKALLDTYTQTEVDLADAVAKKHDHANKALIDSYTQTESDLSGAVAHAAGSVSGHSDVDTTGVNVGDALIWDGVKFAAAAPSGIGEANTASNLGLGTGIFASKVGDDLQFKSLVGAGGVSISATVDEITIDLSGATFSASAITDFSTEVSANADVAANTAGRHDHANKALLDTYMQTETDLADAVTLKHSHSNKALLDTYTQTEVDLADAVTLKHSHSNKALLDTYMQTEVDLADAVTKKHDHANKIILDSISNAGSGDIITNAERIKLAGVEAGAEINQASSVGLGGQDVYHNKTGSVIEFRTIDGSSKVNVTYDSTNKKIVIDIDESLINIDSTQIADKGIANGVASLDGSGKVPSSQLPSSVTSGLSYQGVWDASTNTPALISGTGTQGHYYVVSVAGTTSIDGVNDWQVGDWIIYNGTSWEKNDNSESVSSVNGLQGAVSLVTDNVPEGAANKYFDDALVSANADVTANTVDRHDHANKALLDTYAQTETDLADAVANKHNHANKALLDTYTQTEADLSGAVAHAAGVVSDHSDVNLSGASADDILYFDGSVVRTKPMPAGGSTTDGVLLQPLEVTTAISIPAGYRGVSFGSLVLGPTGSLTVDPNGEYVVVPTS